MNELVSIITPSYNTAEFIGKTIESVQAQTYQNWEMIIVDDCSSDDTDAAVVPYLSDTRIKYIRNETNSGAAVSRNRALREARGRWIAFLDSDDMWKLDKLEKQIEFMEGNYYSFSYTCYEEIDEQGQSSGTVVNGPKRVTKWGMYHYCYPGCLTVMYDANAIGLIQIKDIKKNNDYAMWLQVCRKADCWLLGECLAKYRKRDGSISRHGVKTLIGWHYRLWHEAEGRSIPLSLWFTGWNLFFGFFKKMKYVRRTST